MKAYWITAGVGVLVAVVGAIVYTAGHRPGLGVVLIVGGIIVAILGMAMRITMAYIGDKADGHRA